jgi:hypothetical protein
MYPSFARQGGGKKSWVSRPPSRGNNRHLGAFEKKLMHGQSSWWSVKAHCSSFILKKMKQKHNPTNANP